MSPGITVLTVRESFRRFLHSYRQRGKGAEPMKDEISAILLSPREEDRVKVYADGLLISDAPASPRKARRCSNCGSTDFSGGLFTIYSAMATVQSTELYHWRDGHSCGPILDK